MASTLSLCLVLAAIGGAAPPAAPWNNSGHRIVSLLAWNQLSPPTRADVAALLRAHPRFQADLQPGLPPGSDAMAAARHAFALAANWPDAVRSVTHPMHRVANHPRWHYVELPFVVGEVGAAPPAAAAGEPGPGNILEAIDANLAALADRALPAPDRAIALCWVVHLIEDLHQPLHACTLRSAQFPDGDQGGTRFVVTRSVVDVRSQTSLHALWDGLLGDYQSQAWEGCVAAGLALRPELSPASLAEAVAVRDPAAWAAESHDLGVRWAYLGGELRGAVADTPAAERAPPLPVGYLAAAEAVAMQRAALAAARLADALNRIFDPK
ncbi:MAG: S1/P1 nuclease [Planctomycetes bacterium]|nr:S1/P1 nuclease [Planctomycetota bacterium]